MELTIKQNIEQQVGETKSRNPQTKSISVIIPVYNDRDSILPTRKKLEETLKNIPWNHEIIFVDDGSTDGAKELLSLHKINSISHNVNKGYGAAIKTGAAACTSDYFCIIDCDLTYPPEEIPRLLEYSRDYDMVVGARISIEAPRLHRFGKWFACGVLKRLFKQEVPDINSGLRIFNTKVFREYMPVLCDRFSLTASITFGFLLDGRPIKYVPIKYNKRAGESKVRNLSYIKSFVISFIRMYKFCRRKKTIS